jgi:hypothetical protein
VTRIALLVSTLLFISIIWFALGNESTSDQSPGLRVASQSTLTSLHSETEQTPQQEFIPARIIAKPAPASKSETVAVPQLEKSKKEKPFVMPDWEKIFSSDGSLKDEIDSSGRLVSNSIPDFVDLYDGDMARLVPEIISNGVATDMSALLGADNLKDQILYNGPVKPADDLGNVYFMTSTATNGGPRLFTAVGRLSSQEKTFIEFEFNQHPVDLGSGTPWWHLTTDRLEGDLLVRMEFSMGSMNSVKIFEWQEDAFKMMQTLPGLYADGCHHQASIIYCMAPPRITETSGEGYEVWDENFEIMEPTQADELIELGIDVRELLREQVDFRGLVIRTPQDIAVNTFKRLDRDLKLADLTKSDTPGK